MSASSRLTGLTLDGGWTVVHKIDRPLGLSGGNFSHGYEVKNEVGRKGFLKAFDFSKAFEDGADTMRMLKFLITGFENERDILLHCRERGHSKVSLPLAHGEVDVKGFTPAEGRVYYLIFDMAEGDIRRQVDLSNRGDTLWSLNVLRDACLGLWQVHRDMIAHQDLKPSNVLVYEGDDCRVADFGRASRRGNQAPHDNIPFPGDRTYQPPEFMYGYVDPDFVKRRIGADLYMLGNIACYLFAGVNISQVLMSRLPGQHWPGVWSGTYSDVLPYLTDAFTLALEEITPAIDEIVREEILAFIRQLCCPDLARRGHPRGIGKTDQYSLQRYVSQLDLLCRKADMRARLKKAI